MAQFNSDSHEGLSNLPTNSHAGMKMAHRCAVIFPVAAALAIGDKLVLGQLPPGYTIDAAKADSDGIAGLTVKLVQADSLADDAEELTLATDVSLAAAGQVAATLPLNAVRFKGVDTPLYLVAEVTAGGSVTAGQEVGITFEYRYRQVTY